MNLAVAALIFLRAVQGGAVLQNDYVQVVRNSAPCAGGAAPCGERVFVALSAAEVGGQKMERGDIRVFPAGEPYSAPPTGDFLEVAIKPGHPKGIAPRTGAPAEPRLRVLHDAPDYTVFEEKMEVGEYSPPHSHNVRVAIFLNRTQVQQWTDGKSEIRELEPDVVLFRPAVVHASKDVGNIPIRNILIEFKP